MRRLASVSFADLATGDYIVDDRAVFERKTFDDFAKSMPVLRAIDQEESARLILYAARQLSGLNGQPAVWRHRTPKKMWSRRLHVLQSLPGIGQERAERLLERFGTVEACFSASEEELRDVAGIGAKTARLIRAVVAGGRTRS